MSVLDACVSPPCMWNYNTRFAVLKRGLQRTRQLGTAGMARAQSSSPTHPSLALSLRVYNWFRVQAIKIDVGLSQLRHQESRIASCDGRPQPIMKAQSNICSIQTHSLFIHANTSILKKLNGVSSPSLTRRISRSIYQDFGRSPLGQVSPQIQITNWQTKVANRPWFVCMGSPLSFLYGWFANNAWFGTWVSRADFRCMCE